MGTNIQIGSLGDISIVTGIRAPNHQSYGGTVYKDRNTGFLYKNISGGTSWSYIGKTYAFLVYDFSGASSGNTSTTKFAANIGDGVTTSINVTHGLNSEDIIIEVYRVSSPKDTVFCDIERVDNNNITLVFANPPQTNEYRVIIIS